MTSTDVRASYGPREAGKGRTLCMLAAVLALALAMIAAAAMPAFAVEQTTTTSSTEAGYSSKPPAPAQKKVQPTQKKVEAKKEVKPVEPAVTPAPAEEVEEAAPAQATLPFTGLDLRWVVGGGLVLVLAGGGSLWLTGRRRERHDAGR